MSKHRAVAVFDLDFEDLASVITFQQKLIKAVGELEKPLAGVRFEGSQAEVLLEIRRGKTGPIRNIVFRGTRGPNKRKGV